MKCDYLENNNMNFNIFGWLFCLVKLNKIVVNSEVVRLFSYYVSEQWLRGL